MLLLFITNGLFVPFHQDVHLLCFVTWGGSITRKWVKKWNCFICRLVFLVYWFIHIFLFFINNSFFINLLSIPMLDIRNSNIGLKVLTPHSLTPELEQVQWDPSLTVNININIITIAIEMKTSTFVQGKKKIIVYRHNSSFIKPLHTLEQASCRATDRTVSQTLSHTGQRKRRLYLHLASKLFCRLHWEAALKLRASKRSIDMSHAASSCQVLSFYPFPPPTSLPSLW